ncbi:MAG: GNAT family N-acetyltransferase [Spirochaetia bacterium]
MTADAAGSTPLACSLKNQGRGIGTALLTHAQGALAELGCIKINLQVLDTNQGVIDFYRKHGFSVEPRISMGKVIRENLP